MKNNQVTPENTSIPDNDDLKSELIKKIIDVNNKPFDDETDDEFKEKIIAKRYDEFDQYHLVFNHKIFSQQNIRNYLSKAYSLYYFRFSWLFKYIRSFI